MAPHDFHEIGRHATRSKPQGTAERRIAAYHLRMPPRLATPSLAADDAALFPPSEPFDSGWLDVGDGHRLWYEQCGVPQGLPVVFLHGGPGSGCSARHRRLFDPQLFRVVLFDQRGCGRSLPRGRVASNTTHHVVADIERLREHLGIDRWLVTGGSWGSSLAIAYCAAHLTSCLGALLRGVFLTGKDDVDGFFQGAGRLRPEAWGDLAEGVPSLHSARIAEYYIDAVRSSDADLAGAAVRRWMRWEAALTSESDGQLPLPVMDDQTLAAAIDKYRVQAHYLAHDCFLGEAGLLALAVKMQRLPTAILHGQNDVVCRPANARRLHDMLPDSRLVLVEGAGHSPFDTPMVKAFITASRHFHANGAF